MKRGRRVALAWPGSRSKLLFCCWALWVHVAAAPDDLVAEGKRAFDAGHFGEAARLFEKARESSSRCDIPFYLGLARYRLKQLDAAIIAFQAASQCDPKLLDAHIALGEAYAEKGDDNRALAAFENALKVQSGHEGALRA